MAAGYPAPRLYWFKDGQPLTASEHIRMADRKTLHTLEVLSVTSEDAGQYSAYISNAVGAAYSSARLLVRGGCWGRSVYTWAAVCHTPRLRTRAPGWVGARVSQWTVQRKSVVTVGGEVCTHLFSKVLSTTT